MQFQVLVVIPTNTPDIIGVIEQLVAPYDAEQVVLPYRVNITDEEKVLIAQHYGLQLDDSRLFDTFSNWYGYPCDRDEQGDYYLGSDNPKGYWDGWILQDAQTDVYELPHASMNGIDPLAIVTPDGLWHEMPYRWDESAQQMTQRRHLVQQLLAQYTGHLAVLLHCHR